MKGVCKLLGTKRAPRDVDAYVHPGFADTLRPGMFAEYEQNAVEVCTYVVIEKWIKTVLFSSYYPHTVRLNQYDHMTLLIVAALILSDRRGRMLASNKELFFICNIV